MGSRLLRANILQPSNTRVVIENRLDAVQELTRADALRQELKYALRGLKQTDVDKLIATLSITHNRRLDAALTEQRITSLLQIKKLIRSTTEIKDKLSSCQSTLLKSVKRNLNDARLKAIQDKIEVSLNDDSTLKRSSTGTVAKQAKLYAVKAEYNALLDIARRTLGENTQDIHTIKDNLNELYGFDARLEWLESGARLSVPSDTFEGPLPRELINAESTKSRIKFTTHGLMKINALMVETEQEIFALSEKIVGELVDDIIMAMGGLHRCSEVAARSVVLTKGP
ncbi:DNA mismatch repair protein MutS [Naematelia encephala]|uniref:DNA mismatch repair protein MutS n=1 Tax=Naematelia encephala TaxID=71784 RepID=A0A1Y2BDD6_9TREE|nr:DNA mismatch repair protein MutS [Naematelia encephala]